MSHELDFSKGFAAIAYTGEKPWHGYGQILPQGEGLEVWARAAGLDWEAKVCPAYYQTESGSFAPYPERNVLARSDTGAPLGIVSKGYRPVQPADILDFFRQFLEANQMTMETAGALKGGKRIWGLSRLEKTLRLKGQDETQAYLLVATSFDGSLATTVTPTSIRVCCRNTLGFAVDETQRQAIRVPHNAVFDTTQIALDLGLVDAGWKDYCNFAEAAAERKLNKKELAEFLVEIFGDPELPMEEQTAGVRSMKAVHTLYVNGPGAQMESAKDTLWGGLQAVTRYVDFDRRSKSEDTRLDSAWFGSGHVIKAKALQKAQELLMD